MKAAARAFGVTAAAVFVSLFGTIILTAILAAAHLMDRSIPDPPAPVAWVWELLWFLLQHPISPSMDELAPLFLNPLFWSITFGLFAAILWAGAGPFCRYVRADRLPMLLAALTAVAGLILIFTSPQVGGNVWWIFAIVGTVAFIGGGYLLTRHAMKEYLAPPRG